MIIEKWDWVTETTGKRGEVIQDGCTRSLIRFPADPISGCDYEQEWVSNADLVVVARRREKLHGDEEKAVEIF